MMIVPTYLAPSRINGIGLFAGAFISKGTVVWEFDGRVDLLVTDAEFDAMPPATREVVERYAYINEKGHRIFCNDNAKFMNHEDDANLEAVMLSKEYGVDRAKRDIQEDEELTIDYRQFDIVDRATEGLLYK
jgi:uncharacterized protein